MMFSCDYVSMGQVKISDVIKLMCLVFVLCDYNYCCIILSLFVIEILGLKNICEL